INSLPNFNMSSQLAGLDVDSEQSSQPTFLTPQSQGQEGSQQASTADFDDLNLEGLPIHRNRYVIYNEDQAEAFDN
ncbi:MAG: hypothetical protein M1823_006777, partial [Watsoniomyces obsoletus]